MIELADNRCFKAHSRINSGTARATIMTPTLFINFFNFVSSGSGRLGCIAIQVHANIVAIQLWMMSNVVRVPDSGASRGARDMAKGVSDGASKARSVRVTTITSDADPLLMSF